MLIKIIDFFAYVSLFICFLSWLFAVYKSISFRRIWRSELPEGIGAITIAVQTPLAIFSRDLSDRARSARKYSFVAFIYFLISLVLFSIFTELSQLS
jgi:hypothetical protein